jgi:2,3-bisphosphoglycerate-independent phosphoglycerate mutase
MNQLEKSNGFGGPEGPVVLVIMDGVGIGRHPESDFVARQYAEPGLAA